MFDFGKRNNNGKKTFFANDESVIGMTYASKTTKRNWRKQHEHDNDDIQNKTKNIHLRSWALTITKGKEEKRIRTYRVKTVLTFCGHARTLTSSFILQSLCCNYCFSLQCCARNGVFFSGFCFRFCISVLDEWNVVANMIVSF